AAGDDRLEAPSGWRTAAHVVQEVLEGKTKGHLVVAGPGDVATNREQLGSGAARIVGASEALVPLRTIPDDVRNGRERFNVVDRGWLTEQACNCRERRLDTRIATPSLERVHEGGFLAADVRTGALVDNDINALAAAHCVLAQDAVVVCLTNRAVHPQERLGELATYIDVRRLGAYGVCPYRNALHESVRRPPHDLAILERSRLRFIGIAAQIVRPAIAGLHERPLDAGGEACASAPAKSGFLHDIHDACGLHGQRRPQRFI